MLTLVIPVYRNEGNLPDLLVAIAGVNTQLDNDLEVVFVVDGSPDRCYEILREKLPSQPSDPSSFCCRRTLARSWQFVQGCKMAAGTDLR